MANPWITHVKKTMKAMKKKGTYAKGKGLAQVIKEAKKSWKKGGAEEGKTDVVTTPETTPSMGGGRTRRNKRHGRK